MSGPGHNNPPVTIELTPEQAVFLRDHHDAATGTLLGGLQLLNTNGASRENMLKLVEALEKHKEIRAVLRKAIGDD